jgi:hypothetical protein
VREILYSGPEPPPGRQWCAVSALEFKTAVEKAAQGRIAVAQQQIESLGPYGLDMLEIAAGHGIALPHEAALTAPCVALGGIPVPLCWTHAPTLRAASPLAAGVGLVPVPGQVIR